MTMQKCAAALLLGLVCFSAHVGLAQETGWSMAVNPLSDEAQQIRQQDILDRPNRPGHVYGNTVRRMHYHGHPLPMPVYRSYGGFRR